MLSFPVVKKLPKGIMGEVVFHEGLNKICAFDGTQWVDVHTQERVIEIEPKKSVVKTLLKIIGWGILILALPLLLVFGGVLLVYVAAIVTSIISFILILFTGFFPVLCAGVALGAVLWLIVKLFDR